MSSGDSEPRGQSPQDWQTPAGPRQLPPFEYAYLSDHAYPPPGGEKTRTHAVIALVISLMLAVTCFLSVGGIIGAVLSGVALSKVETQPEQARGLLTWGWVANGLNVAFFITVIGIVAVRGQE